MISIQDVVSGDWICQAKNEGWKFLMSSFEVTNLMPEPCD